LTKLAGNYVGGFGLSLLPGYFTPEFGFRYEPEAKCPLTIIYLDLVGDVLAATNHK